MTGLLDLPFDVLSMIFRELPVVDIILIRLVSAVLTFYYTRTDSASLIDMQTTLGSDSRA